jgi:flagellin-like protein
MKFLKENEDAVSPVIGVILMVAITVILAAVIAAFVFGMASSVQSTKSVAATAKQTGNDIWITYQGGPDNVDVSGYNITVNGVLYSNYVPSVGNVSKFGGGATPSGKNPVTVIAAFTDGSQQVILDTTV